ncbi:MAG: hypothetical protein ACM3MJ_03320, partial [Deltaproteobacteria bacterium]
AQPATAAPVDSVWQRVYNGNASGQDTWSGAAPGPNGGVFVGGMSVRTHSTTMTTMDIVVARYAADGRRLWFRAFDGSGGSNDWMNGLAGDGRGNALVVGSAYGPGMAPQTRPQVAAILKYGPNGQLRWARYYRPPAAGESVEFTVVAADASGAIYAGGYASGANAMPPHPAFLVKYSPSGKRLWARTYARSTFPTIISDIALDRRGGIYLTGASGSAGRGWDMTTIKYRADGTRRWVRHLDDADGGDDEAKAIAVVGGGVYLAGYLSAPSTGADATVVKYTTRGVYRWAQGYNGGTNDYEAFGDIVGLADGGVAATGNSTSIGPGPTLATNSDALVVGLSANGATRWSAAYNSAPEYLDDGGSRIVQARSGAIYVAGASVIAPGRDPDVLLLKFSAAGAFRWARTHGAGTNHGSNALVAVPGGIYVAATEYNTVNDDGLLLKYLP